MTKFILPNSRRVFQGIRSLVRREQRAVRFHRIHRRFSEYTMIPQEIYVDNLLLAERVAGLRGCVVECGVWRGGMSAGLATVLGPERDYFLFDSFEGLPPAKRIDGEAALKWQSDYASPAYFDNCTAPVSFARRAMELSGVTSFQLVEGWFDDTLVGFVPQEPIVLLRLDGDWYDSTMTCLEALFDYVIPDGLIVVDDYHIWDGCSRAVHDFLSRRSAVERIESLGNICFVKKRPQINVEKSTPGKTQSNGLPA